MKFIATAVLVASCALAAFAAIQAPAGEFWDDAFPPGNSLPQICMNIGCVDENLCFIAGGSNGAGFGVFSYDGKLNGQVAEMNMNNASEITIAVEAAGTAAAPKGASGGMSTFFTPGMPSQHYYDAANNVWQPSGQPTGGLAIANPSISASKDGSVVAAVDGGMPAGLLVSTDGAQTYTLKPLTGYPSPNLGNCSTANVVEVAGTNTFYIILGQEPQTASSSSSSSGGSQRKTIRHKNRDVTLDVSSGSIRVSSTKAARPDPRSGVDSGETCVGYSYQVIKTTDGGNTYTSQLEQSNASFTFYGIDCLDADHCVMVGGNAVSSVVYMTKDGSTWNEVYTVEAGVNGTIAFSDVAYVNGSDIWIGGSLESSNSGVGMFYYTRDGGRTWFEYTHLQYSVAEVMAISFPSATVGFAVGVTQEQTSTVLKYAPQPYYGYFAQKQCLTDACDFLCEEVFFPQGMCIESNTGGIVATCSSSGLEIKSYVTTSCIGSYNTSSAPLNQCLNSTNGGPLAFFENLCNVGETRKDVAQHSKAFRKVLY